MKLKSGTCFLITFFSLFITTSIFALENPSEKEPIDNEKKYFNLKVNASIGGGYDSNLFRERFPLTDDFDYPSFQPDVTRESALFDLAGKAVLAYTLPEVPIWRKSVLSFGVMGSYSRVARESENSNLSLENFYSWGILGDWLIQFTGDDDDEGLFFVIRDTYKQTRYNDAENYIESQSPGTSTDTYNYNENHFKLGLGYMFPGFPPIGFEYKLSTRSSPERSNAENYDYGPGPLTFRLFTGLFVGRMSSNSQNNESINNEFDPYSHTITATGFLFKFTGEYWSREYDTYRARESDGTLTVASPLLKETRRSITVDMHFGTTIIAPIFDTRQINGLHLHYQWYRNQDNFEDYYDYQWHRGWAAYYASFNIFRVCIKYEYHWKKFDERNVAGESNNREDEFHVAGIDVSAQFTDYLNLSLEYSYINGDSNERLNWINYDKHYFYATLRYILDLDF